MLPTKDKCELQLKHPLGGKSRTICAKSVESHPLPPRIFSSPAWAMRIFVDGGGRDERAVLDRPCIGEKTSFSQQ